MRKVAAGTGVTQTELVANIVAVINTATGAQTRSGIAWYAAAHNFCVTLADSHGLESGAVIAACAALSPRTPWNTNQNYLIKLAGRYAAGTRGSECYAGLGLGSNALKAYQCLDGDITVLGGNKVLAFWQNILYSGCDMSVTVDGHAYNIALLGLNRVAIGAARDMSDTVYAELATAYRAAGVQLSLTGAHCQAIAWVVYRELAL